MKKLRIVLCIITINTLLISAVHAQESPPEIPSIDGAGIIMYPNGDAGFVGYFGGMLLNGKDLTLKGWLYSSGDMVIYFHAIIWEINPRYRDITFSVYYNFRDSSNYYPRKDEWVYYGEQTMGY
jgi:hypothetical protein